MKLERLFLSRARGEVLRLLFGLVRASVHLRALERQTSLTYSALRQELKKLEAFDLVVARRDGNRLYYTANESHPLFWELHRIVLKTDGLIDVLRDALGTEGVSIAFVFGSTAQHREDARSDVDLLVVGTLGLREASSRLYRIEDKVGREVNPITRTKAELKQAIRNGDPFFSDVMKQPKLFVVGDQSELDAVVG